MKIRDIMQENIETIKKDATVKDALTQMFEKTVTSLLVIGEDGNHGIITRKDIINEIVAKEQDPDKLKVGDIMSTPLLTTTAEIDITSCAQIMNRCGLRHLPVTEDGKIIGFISNSEIFKAASNKIN